MRKWTKAAGLLFLAASAVYSEGVLRAAPGNEAKNPTKSKGPVEVKPLEDAAPASTDVFADPTGTPADKAAPSTQPTAAVAAPKPAGATSVAVKDIGTVEVHVNDASLVEVLKMLSIQSQKNIVASKDVRGTITANLYDVTVKEALDAILKSNGYDYREKGNFIFVYTQKELEEMEKAAAVKKTEMFRLYYTPAANAANMIKPVLSTEGAVSFTTPAKTGIEAGGSDVGGNDHATEDLLVVTDFPERLDQVRAVLKEVDRRPQQILVEAVILRATLQENNDLGIDFTVLGGVDFNTLGGIGSATPSGSGVDQLLSGQIMNNSGAGGITDAGAFGGRAGGSGLKLGFVKNNVGMFLSALEGVTDTVVMANPKVLVLNKQKGEVHVGSQQGYRTAVATETLTADDVKFLDTGTRLAFRPYVGDSGYVRMEIHPEDSSGSVNAQGLPNKFVTQVTSNVMVKDGHTIVIGGLFRESTDRTRSQVPGLGSLPGVGPAFRRQTDNTVREEVIILLTPHIVKDEKSYTKYSEDQLKESERLRVGMRKGLMPWGRERMAEAWFEKAQSELRKENPDRQKALWYLNSATNLNPKFSEAVDLKSKVSGIEASASDNSSIKHFVAKMVMDEKGKEFKYPSDTPPIEVPSGERSVKAKKSDSEPKEVSAPSSQPALAEAPATKPVEAPVAAGPASQPTIAERKPDVPTESEPEVANKPEPVVPATKPVEPATTVTELPIETEPK
ncbi:secretin and TonB N-terminal domain-containing protein [Humisphaera borealis]|uniref:Secretin and TonB N-terminal domain-containing protein n=1 Tax=Humisphaera borealis TaxID=2807512 RepID=A0A7M2WXV1_9BACT|nr:secretin and TonB N-terminal domain-containing protein [Humisphaera borealis]QOV90233.1 secretin and TonB N-terminal domain-containing protein [Humisphaera borealis]